MQAFFWGGGKREVRPTARANSRMATAVAAAMIPISFQEKRARHSKLRHEWEVPRPRGVNKESHWARERVVERPLNRQGHVPLVSQNIMSIWSPILTLRLTPSRCHRLNIGENRFPLILGASFSSPCANNELADAPDYFPVIDGVLAPQNFLQGIQLLRFVFGARLESRKSIAPTGGKRHQLYEEILHLAIKKQRRVMTQSLPASLLRSAVRDTVRTVVWSN